MSRKHDPLGLAPHWHVDCRIEAELPEDNIVGTRFLINALFSGVALGMVLFAGWLGFLNFNLHRLIENWDHRMRENRSEVRDIQRMQQEYAVEAAKIDQAYTLVRPHFFVSGLIMDLGRTRPDPVMIEVIEWNDAGVIVRGNLRSTSEQATVILGKYVKDLVADEKIGPLFDKIGLVDIDRGLTGDTVKFEILLKPKPVKP